jgi:hypothetical protein
LIGKHRTEISRASAENFLSRAGLDHPFLQVETRAIMSSPRKAEIGAGNRFGFAANRGRFLRLLNDDPILRAQCSLGAMSKVSGLRGERLLGIGSFVHSSGAVRRHRRCPCGMT